MCVTWIGASATMPSNGPMTWPLIVPVGSCAQALLAHNKKMQAAIDFLFLVIVTTGLAGVVRPFDT